MKSPHNIEGGENTQPPQVERLENPNQQLMDYIEEIVVMDSGNNTEMVVNLFDELDLDNKIKVAEAMKEYLNRIKYFKWPETREGYEPDRSVAKMVSTVLSVLGTDKGLPEKTQKSSKQRVVEGEQVGVERKLRKRKEKSETMHVSVSENESEKNTDTTTPAPTPAEEGSMAAAFANSGKLKESAKKPKVVKDPEDKSETKKVVKTQTKPKTNLKELEKEFAPAFEAAKEKPVAKNPEKKEVKYKPFTTLEDVESAIDKIVEDKETDKFVLNNTYNAADVLFGEIVDPLYDESEKKDFVATDDFKNTVQNEIKKFENLERFLNTKTTDFGYHSGRKEQLRLIHDIYYKCVRRKTALTRFYNELQVNKVDNKKPVETKPEAVKKQAEKKDIPAKKEGVPTETQKESTSGKVRVANVDQIITILNKETLTTKDLAACNKWLSSAVEDLNTNIDRKDLFKNGFTDYLVTLSKDVFTLREALIGKYSSNKDNADSVGLILEKTDIMEAINKSSDNKNVVEILNKIISSVDQLYSTIRSEVETLTKEQANNEPKIENKEAKKPAKETPPEPITPPTPEPTPEPVEPPTPIQTVKTLSDILAPRSMEDPLDEAISGDVEFNKFMMDILETSIKLSVGVKPEENRDSIEDLYKVYTETKPTIDKLKAAMESGQMNNLFKDSWHDHNKIESTKEEIEMANKLYFQELQYTAFYSRNNPAEMKAIQTVIESAEKAKKHETAINDLEQEVARLHSALKPEGEEIDPKTVYESIGANPTEATQERLRELHDFAEDLHLNYAFYGGLDNPIDANKMYKLYKATHQKTTHQTEKIPTYTRAWTKIKNVFSKEKIDPDEVNKFTNKINIFIGQRLIPVNKRDSLESTEENFRKFNAFMEMAIQGLKAGKDILDPKFVGEMKNTGDNSAQAGGREIFMKVYESYTDLRALDADMQARARRNNSHIADRIRTTNTSLEHAKNEKQAESSQGLKTSPEHLEILKQAKISIALDKIKEVRAGLQNFKKKDSTTPTAKTKKGGMMPSVNSAEKTTGNASSIDKIMDDYSYASNILEKTSPEDISDEDAMLFKTTRLMFLEKVLQSDESMTKRLQEVLKKHFSTYNGVAESDMPKEEKTKFFDSIITELNAKITPKTQPLEKHQLESIIKQFEAIKSSIK